MGLKSVVMAATMAAAPAWADFDPEAYPPYETCALCHGLFGVSHSAKFPNLAGQNPSYIRAQIEAFLAGERTNDGGQMAAIVTELDPQAIPIVIEWFASQDPPAPDISEKTEGGAVQFADLGCAGCHDNTERQAQDVPYLSAQHARYLEKQMQDFVEQRRFGKPVHKLHKTLLSDPGADLHAIASYLAAEERP